MASSMLIPRICGRQQTGETIKPAGGDGEFFPPSVTAVFAQYYTFIQTIMIFRRRRPALDLTILARYHILSLLYLICLLLWWTSCSRQMEHRLDIFHNSSRHLEAELSGFHQADVIDVFTKSVCSFRTCPHVRGCSSVLFTNSFFCGIYASFEHSFRSHKTRLL